jgi:hypothetical protein
MTLGQERSRSGNSRSKLLLPLTPAAHVHPCGSLDLWRAVNLPVHCSVFGRTSCVVLRACRLVLRPGIASSVACRAETQRQQRQQHPQRQRPS